MKTISQKRLNNFRRRLRKLYPEHNQERIESRLYQLIGRYGVGIKPVAPTSRWNKQDVVLITYGDMVQNESEAPLRTLASFCTEYMKGAINTIHILPFYPWTSDDGFSVVDYREVDPHLGNWDDVENVGENFHLMFDLVLNHCSAESTWFKNYLLGIYPDKNYFIEMDPEEDLSMVTRPRTSPLLTPTQTRDGERHVWTTFSADQVDLNWENPDVLFEFLDIILMYVAKGARILRLDAVAFLWKKLGTNCLHLDETHEAVKFIRDLLDLVAPHVIILTETNVPHEENVSYFGKGDEAHMVYNFSLPPLTLHALLTGNGKYLTDWAMNLSEPPKNCTYFNFTASHDGIGVRPLQGLLPAKEFNKLTKGVRDRKGKISMKTNPDGSESPYEMNITYYEALTYPKNEDLSIQRFLCSQAIALSFKGVPGIYFHSLVACLNNQNEAKKTGIARRINRYKWNDTELKALLEDKETLHHTVFRKYIQLIRRRTNHPAFSPDARMLIHDIGESLFCLTRTSIDGAETIFCVYNLTDQKQSVQNPQSTELLKNAKSFYDIISGKTHSSGKKTGIELKPYQAMWLTAR